MQRSSGPSTTEDHVLDLAWSLWAELGVSGWQRNHRSFAVDPEVLILLTAWLQDLDPRLRDESTDWCIRYGKFISATRLKNLLRTSGWTNHEKWSEFAATVNANSPWRWPADDAEPRDLVPSGKSRIENFDRPSLSYLRVRALVGVGARAEIVRLFSFEPRARFGVAQIAAEIGYSKRNAAEALDGLEMAGVLQSLRIRNRLEYAATDPDRLGAVVGPQPEWSPRWVPIASVITRVTEFIGRAGELSEPVASVECVTLIQSLGDDLAVWGVPPPPLVVVDEPAYPRIHRWSVELLAALAAGDPKILVGRQGPPQPSRVEAR